jgi:hypothetical protein
MVLPLHLNILPMTLNINGYHLKLKVRVNPSGLEAQNKQDHKDEEDQFNLQQQFSQHVIVLIASIAYIGSTLIIPRFVRILRNSESKQVIRRGKGFQASRQLTPECSILRLWSVSSLYIIWHSSLHHASKLNQGWGLFVYTKPRKRYFS